MTRVEKEKIVSDLTEEFKDSDAVLVCDYKGLTVNKLEVLRNMAREVGVEVKVIKNTLALLAMNNANFSGIELKDTNIFLWGKDQLEVVKVAAKFSELSDLFNIKIGYIDGTVASEATIIALSKIPSRNELLGMLLQVWNAPVTNFTIGLNALKEKKESA